MRHNGTRSNGPFVAVQPLRWRPSAGGSRPARDRRGMRRRKLFYFQAGAERHSLLASHSSKTCSLFERLETEIMKFLMKVGPRRAQKRGKAALGCTSASESTPTRPPWFPLHATQRMQAPIVLSPRLSMSNAFAYDAAAAAPSPRCSSRMW